MDSYNKKAIFHLPEIFKFTAIYEMLLRNYREHPETFKDNVVIGSVYGSPAAIWNGGRLMLHAHPGRSALENLRNMMEQFDVPVRFTFTNCLLEEKHLQDTYCNLLLEVFSTGKHEVICNMNILENYIRNKYGDKYKYISSTTKRLVNKSKQQEELKKDYYLVVLDYDHNKDFTFLKNIKNKDKCEILCNPICVAGCPLRKKHYESISQCQLDFDETKMIECPHAKADTLWGAMLQKNFIGPEDINTYLDMGFSNFKLEGRTMAPSDLIEVLIYYLIKEEYQREIRTHLQSLLWR